MVFANDIGAMKQGFRIVLLILAAVLVAQPLTACGKRGDLVAPAGTNPKDSEVELRRYK